MGYQEEKPFGEAYLICFQISTFSPLKPTKEYTYKVLLRLCPTAEQTADWPGSRLPLHAPSQFRRLPGPLVTLQVLGSFVSVLKSRF